MRLTPSKHKVPTTEFKRPSQAFDAFGGYSVANNIVFKYRKAYDPLGATTSGEVQSEKVYQNSHISLYFLHILHIESLRLLVESSSRVVLVI